MTGLRDDFLPALLDPQHAVPADLQDGQGRPAGRRFDVYRNNVAASLITALEQGFPAVAKLLGPDNFVAVARMFVRDHPPRSRLMMHYGAGFAEFLQAAPPLAHLGYLGDVARLELALRRAYHAADTTPLDPAILAAIPPQDLAETRLILAPTVEVIRSPWPVYAIWAFNMIPGSPKPTAQAQDVLITRPDYDPVAQPLPSGGAAFVTALQGHQPLGTAYDAALAQNEHFDLPQTLGLLIAGAAITGLDPARAIP
jgi:hypothetical protein